MQNASYLCSVGFIPPSLSLGNLPRLALHVAREVEEEEEEEEEEEDGGMYII